VTTGFPVPNASAAAAHAINACRDSSPAALVSVPPVK